jgi:SAM-dependent methyltransferase
MQTWNQYNLLKARGAQKAFAQASSEPAWLTGSDLEALEAAYQLEEDTYSYDEWSVEKRGEARVQELMKLLPNNGNHLNDFFDLGSWDGMLGYALERVGKRVVGADIRVEGLTEKAKNSPVSFVQMDVEALGLAGNSFDVALSYNSFEHFPDPEKALSESIRVVRPGGYIYLNFGPLYLSPKGAHQFTVFSVPYCQCLFPKELLLDFAAAKGIELVDFRWMNEWSVSQFRKLWQKYSAQLETVFYYEMYKAEHVALITRYPSCFKSKTDSFDELLVSYIEVLFRK